jgi:hypothetical protein
VDSNPVSAADNLASALDRINRKWHSAAFRFASKIPAAPSARAAPDAVSFINNSDQRILFA